jgi:hypothetical protein
MPYFSKSMDTPYPTPIHLAKLVWKIRKYIKSEAPLLATTHMKGYKSLKVRRVSTNEKIAQWTNSTTENLAGLKVNGFMMMHMLMGDSMIRRTLNG